MKNKTIIMISAGHQRSIARRVLEGQWKNAVIATLIMTIAISVPPICFDTISLQSFGVINRNFLFVGMIYILIISGPFSLGYAAYILRLFRKQSPSISEVFSGFSNVIRSIMLFLAVSLLITLWSLPALVILMSMLSSTILFSINATVIGLAVVWALLIFPIKAAIDYSQVFFVALDNENMPVMMVLKQSKYLMSGNVWKYICINLSFIGWSILASLPTAIVNNFMGFDGSSSYLIYSLIILVSGICYLWLTPYITTTLAGFYEIVSGNVKIQIVPDIILSKEDIKEIGKEADKLETLEKAMLPETKEEAKIEIVPEISLSKEDAKEIDKLATPEITKLSETIEEEKVVKEEK